MGPGPILLLEKSTVQGLNPSEISVLWRYYSPVVCPMLMRELLSNLAKEMGNREETEKRLAALAAKVDMPGFYVTAEASFMAANNLLGVELPMDGRVPMPGGIRVRSKDGRHGIIFDEPPEHKILRKWQARQFSEDEKEFSKRIRGIDLDVDLKGVQELLAEKAPRRPPFSSLSELISWIDQKFVESISNRNHLMAAGASLLSATEMTRMLERWEKTGRPSFRRFAPYAYYFYRCTIIYYLGLAFGFVSASKKAKTHLDIQYLFYLPFCMVFTSGDIFLREMFPFFKRENQLFLWKDDLKSDLQKVNAYWDGLTEHERTKVRQELGGYPPEISGSLTHEVWQKLMRPRPKTREATPKPTKETEKRLVEQIVSHYTGAIRMEDNKSTDPSVFKKYETLSLSERTSALIDKCVDVIGLNSGKTWAHVKKEFSVEHVRAIYNFYSDIWRPDTDLTRLLSPDPSVFRVLYLGEVDPHTIVQNVLGSLLYFDQVAVVNPFVNSWSITEEENPLVHPEQYEGDLLKTVYLLLLLSPWIENGQVILVPDPTDFDIKFKWDLLKIAPRKKLPDGFESSKDYVLFEKLQMENLLRYNARLPDSTLRAMFKRKDPNITEEAIADTIQFFREERARDPIAIDRNFTGSHKEMFMARSGAGCEVSLILCRLLGAVPFTSLAIRMNDYRQLKKSQNGRWDGLSKVISESKFKFLRHVDYALISVLKHEGYLSRFRVFFRQLISRLNAQPNASDEEIRQLTNDISEIAADSRNEWSVIEEVLKNLEEVEFHIGEGHLVLDIEEDAYMSTDLDSLWTQYVKGAEGRPLVRTAFHLDHD